MGALPKHKISTFRKGRRRATIKLNQTQTVKCRHCGQPKRPHYACEKCGQSYHPAT